MVNYFNQHLGKFGYRYETKVHTKIHTYYSSSYFVKGPQSLVSGFQDDHQSCPKLRKHENSPRIDSHTKARSLCSVRCIQIYCTRQKTIFQLSLTVGYVNIDVLYFCKTACHRLSLSNIVQILVV